MQRMNASFFALRKNSADLAVAREYLKNSKAPCLKYKCMSMIFAIIRFESEFRTIFLCGSGCDLGLNKVSAWNSILTYSVDSSNHD